MLIWICSSGFCWSLPHYFTHFTLTFHHNYIDWKKTYLNYVNPDYVNPDYVNPDYVNPDYINPDYINPDYINPDYINPDYVHPDYHNPIILTWIMLIRICWSLPQCLTGRISTPLKGLWWPFVTPLAPDNHTARLGFVSLRTGDEVNKPVSFNNPLTDIQVNDRWDV